MTYTSEIPDDSQNQIWLPLNWIIHENAVVGSVVQDSSFFLGIECKSSEEPAYIEDRSQDVMHSGHKNSLVMIKKFRVVYPCQMNITSFPFDQQNCKFALTMDTRSNTSVILTSLLNGTSVRYTGPDALNEFELDQDIKYVSRIDIDFINSLYLQLSYLASGYKFILYILFEIQKALH